MKLSRHGKHTNHSRRGRRHTKRAGKHLKYRGKKVRVSKRYSRGQKRTYKRGKRFQMGGVVCDGVDYNWTENGNMFECNVDVRLFYSKRGPLPFPTRDSMFSVKIRLGSNFKNCRDGKENLTIQFTRQPTSDRVRYSFSDLDNFTGDKLKRWKLEKNKTIEYDFSDTKNTEILKCISDFIKNKIKEVYQNIVSLLKNCKMNDNYGLVECRDSDQLFGIPDVFPPIKGIRSLKGAINAAKQDLADPAKSEFVDSNSIEIERLKGHIAELDVISVPNGKDWKTIKISELILKNIRLLIKIGEYILYLLGFDILDADNLTNLKNAKTNFIRIFDNITDNYFYTQHGLDYERYIDKQLSLIAPAAVVHATNADAANGDTDAAVVTANEHPTGDTVVITTASV